MSSVRRTHASLGTSGGDSTPLMQGGQRRHRPDYRIILFMGLLMLIGLIVMYAIGPQRANV
ncbi:MAG: hypothetical protein ABIP74_00260, partial [Candidatus Saccharimonas sp.]